MVTVRRARQEDAEKLLLHTRQILHESENMLTVPEEFQATVEEERQWIIDHGRPGNLLLTAWSGEELAGVLNFTRKTRKKVSHIGMFGISIKEKYCNQGIGKQLIGTCLEWAKEEPGIEKVCLEVFSHNERGIHLYKKMGFQEEGRRIRHVKNFDGSYSDELLMFVFVK
ncbi:N-acetyltransferase family protein [Bacillus infantis]|uniref:GNAT family N-acetyltransferase n=1 Tax=Bacillus infantis TaxID=324767 RepID=UPI003CED51B7